MKRNSHLILTLHTSTNHCTFVELCGSELAATSMNNNVVGKQVAQQKKFVTQSFNSLSQVLIAAATGTQMNKDQYSVLTKVLHQIMMSVESKIVMCCTVGPSQHQFRHSITALKFASKIREVITKKLIRNNKNIFNMDNELKQMSLMMSQKISNEDQQCNREFLLTKFNTLK